MSVVEVRLSNWAEKFFAQFDLKSACNAPT